MSNDDLDRVVPMDDLDDFRVAGDAPDPRGWEVVAADGRRIGEVDELLVDTGAMKVRYLDVDVDDEVSAEPDRHVLVPIGYARLDRDHDRVIVDQLSSADLRAIPAYRHGPITRDFENSVRESWRGGHPRQTITADHPTADRPAGDAMRADARDDFYSDDVFDETSFWASRRSTGLGGALGDIGNDAGYPRDLENRG
ncbi:MAG TPA: PRC-barrel domain-containing protein [Longimicrobium sp.]|nr:PRC-barrel domain-containing protein [Longimicrobium sp.]